MKNYWVAIGLSCFVFYTANAENFVPLMRTQGSFPYSTEIDLDSIAQVGSLRSYRVRWFGFTYNDRRELHEMVADCSNRKRGQYAGSGSLSEVSFYSIYDGTVAAQELDVVCGNDSARSPKSAPQIADAPPRISVPSPQASAPPIAKARASKTSGSGFIVASGLVVTNEHVISGCENLFVSRGLIRTQAVIRSSSKRSDLALLQVNGLKLIKPPNIRRAAQLGEDVTVAGHPLSGLLSSDITVTSGQVNALAGIQNDPTLLQISAPVQSGNSGGPVLDKFGGIVGVVVSKLNVSKAEKFTGDFAQNINFAIKPEILRLFLDSTNISYKDAATSRKLDNVEIASSAKQFTVLIECE